jgi:hypothetical protein
MPSPRRRCTSIWSLRDCRSITGEAPPRSLITVETYKAHGLPWFELLDDDLHDLPVQSILAIAEPISFG